MPVLNGQFLIMKPDIRLNLEKKVDLLHDLLVAKVSESHLPDGVRKWVFSYIDLLESRYYITNNIDDLLWFYKNGLSKNHRILDFGTGGGYITYLVADLTNKITAYEYIGKWSDQHYTNSTYSSAFSFAHKVVNEIEPEIQFKFYDRLPLKEKSKTFDGIILYAVIEHIDSKIKDDVLTEMYRILKPDGLLYIAKLPRLYSYQEFISRKLKITGHSDLYTKNKINKLLNKHSFKIVKIEQTGLFVNTNIKITDGLFPIFNFLEKILKFLPINFFAHDYRLIARKI